MGKRLAIVIGAAALGAAVMAVGASADLRSVHDPRGDTRCLHERTPPPHRPCSDSTNRDGDIVRATAGHDGTRLRHTIRVVGKFQGGYLLINTDSDRRDCEREVFIERGRGRSGEVRECHRNVRTGRARMDFHRHSVEIVFSERSIGNPRAYGWFAGADAGPSPGHANDQVPNVWPRYIRHRLAQPAAAASAGVVKYETKVTITKERGLVEGGVTSEVRKCERGRRVVLFKLRPGADRKVGTVRTRFAYGRGDWTVLRSSLKLHRGRHPLYAKVTRKEGDQYVCRSARSKTIRVSVPR